MTEGNGIERAADLLVLARAHGETVNSLVGDLAPATLSDAYAVQDATLRRLGPVGGWKVAAKPHGEPRCAALPALAIHQSGEKLSVPKSGYELEVETAFVFGRRVRPGDDVLSSIRSVHLAIEVLGSRFADRRSLHPLQPIADMQSNAAIVVGPPVAEWEDHDLATLDMDLRIDGAPIAAVQRHHSREQAVSLLSWLAAHSDSRGLPLDDGTVVITGARIGPLSLGAGKTAVASCAHWGAVAVNFAP